MGVPAQFCCLCGKHTDEVGPLSERGRCGGCATLIVQMNIEQMRGREGPFHQHWGRRLAQRVSAQVLDAMDEAG